MTALLAIGVATKLGGVVALADTLNFNMNPAAVLQWSSRLIRVANSLQASANGLDRAALDEMVETARASAPVRTGRLREGITGEREGDFFVFRASAVGLTDDADYARFVEFGTRPGRRVADQAFFDAPARASRRKGHPGTEAQPYFWPAVRAVLSRRYGKQAQEMIAAAKSAGGTA